MKYIGAAFFSVATMLGALTIAIARESGQLGKYEWAVPYLIVAIVASMILGITCLIKVGRQQEKQSAASASPPQSSPFNINFSNVGNPVHDQSNRQTVAASLPLILTTLI
jgi:hypothetical protein